MSITGFSIFSFVIEINLCISDWVKPIIHFAFKPKGQLNERVSNAKLSLNSEILWCFVRNCLWRKSRGFNFESRNSFFILVLKQYFQNQVYYFRSFFTDCFSSVVFCFRFTWNNVVSLWPNFIPMPGAFMIPILVDLSNTVICFFFNSLSSSC